MTEIQIIGAGGLGRELGACIENLSDYSLKGYYDDDQNLATILDNKLIGPIDSIDGEGAYIIGIGIPALKIKLTNYLDDRKCDFISFIHSNTRLESRETIVIGRGSIICSGAQLTRNISIGAHVLVNLNVTIGHDVTIGNYSSIMPGANISGAVEMGEGVLIGSGAVILQGIHIGDNVAIGAGAVVTKNVPNGATIVGIPGRIVDVE